MMYNHVHVVDLLYKSQYKIKCTKELHVRAMGYPHNVKQVMEVRHGGSMKGWEGGRRGVGERRRCSMRKRQGSHVAEDVCVRVLEEVHVVVHASVGRVALLEAVFQVVESRVELALSLLLLAPQSCHFGAHRTHLALQAPRCARAPPGPEENI